MSYSAPSPRMTSSPSSLTAYRKPSRELIGKERTSLNWLLTPSKFGAPSSTSRHLAIPIVPLATAITETDEMTSCAVVAIPSGAAQEPEVVAKIGGTDRQTQPKRSLKKSTSDAGTNELVSTAGKRAITRQSARTRSTRRHPLFALTTPTTSTQTGSHLTHQVGTQTSVPGYMR